MTDVRVGGLCPECFHPQTELTPFGMCRCGCPSHGLAPAPESRPRTKRPAIPSLRRGRVPTSDVRPSTASGGRTSSFLLTVVALVAVLVFAGIFYQVGAGGDVSPGAWLFLGGLLTYLVTQTWRD